MCPEQPPIPHFVVRDVLDLRLRGMRGRLLLARRLARWNLRRAFTSLRHLLRMEGPR